MDKKDHQILELLAQNCRIPHTTIAQALKISKDTVNYKINTLEKTNILKQYILFIDSRILGFTRYHILLNFDSNLNNKEEIYKKISEHKFVMWINTFIGRFDLQIIVDAKDAFHLNQIKDDLFECCNNKIKEHIILTHLYDLEFTNLNPLLNLKTSFKKKDDHSFSSSLCPKNFPVSQNFNTYYPDKIELQLLSSLSKNPKESLIELGRKLNVNRSTIKKKITNLIENKVILNFGGITNQIKQEFITYYLLVRLDQSTPKSILKLPFEKLQNIFYAGKMLGDYDLILYLTARTPEELNSSIELFKEHIEQYIIHYDILIQDKVHYWKQFTQGLYESLQTQH
ncbi:MAG: winged helix-turn-helix transcriptional regulator [Candidatus Woesearchaeota archaeon]|jgi:DNA-binding Lrp family transcriptional regulator